MILYPPNPTSKSSIYLFTLNSEGFGFDDLMMQISKKKTLRKVQKKSPEVQAQHIMRSAAEKIHVAFRELKRDSITITAEFVELVMTEALSSLIQLKYDIYDDDSEFYFQLRGRTKKDAGVSNDYDVLV